MSSGDTDRSLAWQLTHLLLEASLKQLFYFSKSLYEYSKTFIVSLVLGQDVIPR